MEFDQKPIFIKRLTEVMLAYGKPLHDEVVLEAWWTQLSEFPLRTVALAFRAYREENDTFAPVPNSIFKRCLLMDGRPGAEEAWAIALRGTDEENTVVWTRETAKAFEICRPVLQSSGAISARKPFLEAYTRLVTEARAERRPAEWAVSLGRDKAQYQLAIRGAVSAGLLTAPSVAGLLAGPAADDQTPDDKAREQLAAIKRMLREGMEAKERALEERAEADRLAEDEVTQKIAGQVQEYMTRKPA